MDRKTICGCLIAAVLLLPSCSRQKLIVVGSKNFTEQILLGEIIAQHLEHRLNQPVKRTLDLSGTMLAHEALMSGSIDCYPEYTGTAFTNILKHEIITDTALVLERVKNEYAQQQLDWLDPLGFNNSFAMAVRGDDARASHLETLSDAATASQQHGWLLGAGYEFMQRPDGFTALSAYNIKWTEAPKIMDLGLLYPALLQQKVNMTAGSVTDGMLSKLDVKVLNDDKHVFPPYQASIVVRMAAEAAHPGLKQALQELTGKINSDEMRKLNYSVDAEHKQPRFVAEDFLRSKSL